MELRRHNSLIRIKTAVCKGCGNSLPIKAKGLCQNCYSNQLRLKSYNKSIKAQETETRGFVREKEDSLVMVGNSAELNRWFNDRRLELTGYCHHCGKRSCKDDDKYFKFSICHILPKAYVKSVATNPFNFLELCFWGENSCHSQLDNSMLDLIELNCFDEVVVKFQKMYPSIIPSERRRIPDVLLQYIGTDF